MRYSPNGKWLAVGSHDNKVYILDTAAKYAKKGQATKSSSYITALDWSLDGNAFRTTDGSYELLYYSVAADGKVT
jgi:WD40 repeat protein